MLQLTAITRGNNFLYHFSFLNKTANFVQFSDNFICYFLMDSTLFGLQNNGRMLCCFKPINGNNTCFVTRDTKWNRFIRFCRLSTFDRDFLFSLRSFCLFFHIKRLCVHVFLSIRVFLSFSSSLPVPIFRGFVLVCEWIADFMACNYAWGNVPCKLISLAH